MFKEILDSLMRNKLRTALTGLSVSVGIFLLIFLLGAGNGLIHALEANSGQMALDVLNVWPGQTSMPYDGLEKGRGIRFDNRDIGRMRTAGGGMVTASTGGLSQGSVTLSRGEKAVSLTLGGYYPEKRDIGKVSLVAGRYLNDMDLRERRKVVVVGQKTAEELCGSAARAIGSVLEADGTAFRVVGVYADKGQGGWTEAHVPFTTLQTIYRRGIDVEQLNLRTVGADTEPTDSLLQARLRHVLAVPHRFSPDDPEAVWMYNRATGAKENARAMGYLRTFLWVIGLLTLLSGVVGISNIMLITVKERTHEFGIRKALGARSWSILRSVMAESVIVTAISGYVGLVAGIAATEVLNLTAGSRTMTVVADVEIHTFLNPTVDLAIAFQALAVLVAAGLLAGFFPARKAVRIKPVEALNSK